MDTQNTSTGKPIDLKRLQDKFPASEIEWRVGRAGEKNGKVWATALPYITSRAIQTRLDEVCGPENWKNDFKAGPLGGVVCGIAIRINGEWVWKFDGADNTDVESVKGGLSDAMKRCGVQWSIGRYLYDLGEQFAVINENGQHFGSFKDASGKQVRFRWNPPQLPASDLPSGTPPQTSAPRGETIRVVVQDKPPKKNAAAEPASEAQIGYIGKLAADISVNVINDLYRPRGIATVPNKEQAKQIIDHLKSLKASPARKRPVTEREVGQAERAGMKAA